MKLSKYLDDEKFELLKLEIDTLSSKITAAVDNLWKIRSLEMTLWTAATGVGLGQFSINTQPILPLLVITLFIPIWFFWIDARYNRWYRQISLREREIQKFVNDEKYVLPSVKSSAKNSNKASQQLEETFPVYDLSGSFTFGNDPYYKWETSLTKSFTDTIPIFIYGSQVLASAIVLTMQFQPPIRFLFIPGIVVSVAVFAVYAAITKKKVFRKK